MLQWSNSEMLRFARAADLRAESDNVRRKKEDRTGQDWTADYRCLLFLSSRRAVRSDASATAAFSLVCSFSSLACAGAIENGPLCARVMRDDTITAPSRAYLSHSLSLYRTTCGEETKGGCPDGLHG